ncbi:5-methylthioribose kinase [Actinotalea ferrariae CF5-4]|uniref:S-methyl-5-thioribose kinase n=1 Tax=Actinotalea ferrariae CF5-4 TaxID=948458 RepID=A0A021VQJ1_9CELL|nr:S-methyl-5-thioribose kinase [Actinotalea ferrariae]EYR63406.1 5-methylthioribose kinase [Actinotalea ferrariae CF5-4]
MSADYEFLTVDTVADYVRSRPALAGTVDPDRLASVEEIGDGNLNLVFLLKDEQGRGLVLKQALPYVRMVGEGWPMTPERARFEVDSLRAHHALVPEHVVEVHDFDEPRHIIAMEDLSDHRVWRHALNEGLVHDGAAAAMGRYVAALAFGTSLFALDREELARRLAASVNPQLCLITEDLVFTEPSVDAGRNSVLPANEQDAADLAADEVFVTAMGRAKWTFMTHAEALIHGDLHTGSVMVRAGDGTTDCDSVKAFDSEFAFYGPVAFDLGALWANYVIAAARAFALGEDDRAAWALGLPAQTWDAFETEFRRRWPDRVDGRVWREPFLEELLTRWREETWLFAAAKMSRRIVGAAKTKDIETLPEDLREGAARGVLRTARQAVRSAAADASPAAFATMAGDLLRSTRTV